MKVIVTGGGLAGSEAAIYLANQGFNVDLYEMRPKKSTGAHKTSSLAEIVCSNSLGSNDPESASGLLKAELRLLGSELIKVADESSVPAGNALAVDRELFSAKITEIIENHPNINLIREELREIPTNQPVIIASGPLTSEALSRSIKNLTGSDHLYFYDAIAPIIEKDSINFEIAFTANRYDKGEPSYINCPMNEYEYENFYNILINSPTIELKEFEKGAKFFESCMPVEVMAKRGKDTLRFGPMKPVGFTDHRTGKQPFALVQLRQDNSAASLYNIVGFQTNLKWGAQNELVQSIPGLENANIVRYGVMHRNTFINSPMLLEPSLKLKSNPAIFLAGQITGVEGYTESIATGLLAAINMGLSLKNKTLFVPEPLTMLGALVNYISCEDHKHFQPINSNWGIISKPQLDKKILKNKKLKNKLLAENSLTYLKSLIIEKALC